MAVSLVCPSCGAAVSASEGDRGKSTLCGSCWTEVPVPAASGPVKAAPVAAKPVAAAPVAAKPAVAKPAAAMPVKAAPVAPVAKDEDLDLDLPSPRSRRRDPDDEPDDDRPHRGEKKKGGPNLLLIIGGVVALVLLLGCGGVGFMVYRAYTSTKEFVEGVTQPPEGWNDPNLDPNNNNPFGAAFTPITKTASGKRSWEKNWVPVASDGFSVSMPEQFRRSDRSDGLDGEQLKGARYEAEEANIKYAVAFYDMPNEIVFDPTQFVDKLKPLGTQNVTGVKAITVGGYRATEFTRKTFLGEVETGWVVKVGPRVFQFLAAYDTTWTSIHTGLEPETRKKQFFDSIAISFNPTTPAPAWSKAPKKTNPKSTTPTVIPKLPTFPTLPTQGDPTTAPPPYTPPSTDASFKSVGRIDQFLTAVVLPEKKEILTFANRGPVGLVRRLSPTTYKTIAERVLPNPVIHAVADERNGRLYVATVQGSALVGMEPTNRLTAIGDVQVFDLAAVLSDAPAPGDLKPLASAGLAAKIVGLELDPKGKTVYTATAFLDKAKTKANIKTQVWKLDSANLKKLGDHDVANPLGTIRLSPDGKHLFAAEFPYNSFGSPQFGSADPVTIHVYDAVSWKKLLTTPMPHPVMDVRFLTDDKALVVTAAGVRPMKLLTLDTKGAVVDVTPERVRHNGGFVAVTPDGKKLVLSGRAFSGTEVLLIDEGRFRALGYTQNVGPVSLRGPVVLSPDGKTALYGTGVVVDFSGVGK